MDEPASALDDLSQNRLMELLNEEAPSSTIIHAARRNIDKRFYDREIELNSRPVTEGRGPAESRRNLLASTILKLREPSIQ
jgi:ABC-type uncharacterized transport system fused permease/ATPase subunit